MIDNTFKQILQIIEKDDEIIEAHLEGSINENKDILGIHIEIYIQKSPFNLTYKTHKDLDDFINNLDFYVTISLNSYSNEDYDDLDYEYYDDEDYDDLDYEYDDEDYEEIIICNKVDKKPLNTNNTIHILYKYENNKYLKSVDYIHCNEVETSEDNRKLNSLLNELKNNGYKVREELYRETNVETIDDILLDINSIVKNNELDKELKKLVANHTFLKDIEIQLLIDKRGLELFYIFEGYDFFWNSPDLSKFDNSKIPIKYFLIEKGWYNGIDIADRSTSNTKSFHNPEILINHFKNSLNLYEHNLDAANRMTICVNKGLVENIIDKKQTVYYTDKDDNIILCLDKEYIKDKRKLKEDLNYIIQKFK